MVVAGDDEDEFRAQLIRKSEEIGRDPGEVEEGMRRRNSPLGTWAEVKATLDGYEAAGVDRFWLQALGDEPADVERALERLQG